nr:JAB domain-containing protein [Photobacterium aquae]
MHKKNDYILHTPMTADQVLEKAAEIVATRYLRGNAFTNPQATKDFLQYKMGGYEREVFAVLLLDNQHSLIKYEEVFFDTINAASVYLMRPYWASLLRYINSPNYMMDKEKAA